MPGTTDSGCFEFGGFRLDRRSRTLTGPDGDQVSINAKAFDTLVYLLENPGEVVSRSTLLDALWPDTVVEENNLSQAVAALRRVLGEGFILTVPRRGYQFVAEVRTMTQPEPAEGEVAAAASALPRPLRKVLPFRWWHALAFLVLATGVFVAVEYSPVEPVSGGATRSMSLRPIDASETGSIPRVIVLPCENLSPDPADAYFADGIHQQIIDQLRDLGIGVVPRTSVMSYADPQNRPSISELARRHDAAAVLECSVRHALTEVRVDARLIDPRTEMQLRSDTYPGDLGDLTGLFSMQADIANNITQLLAIELSAEEERRLAARHTDSPEAYELYLRHLAERPIDNLSDLDRAIEADPDFAIAYTVRGLAHVARAVGDNVPGGPYDFDTEMRLAASDAESALAVDSELGRAHLVLVAARYFGSEDPDQKRLWEAGVERALALSPNAPLVLYVAGGSYLKELRPDDAHRSLVRIAELAPPFGLVPFFGPSWEFLFLTGDLDAAARVARAYLEASGDDDVRNRQGYAFSEAVRGNLDQALRLLAEAEEHFGEKLSGVNRAGFWSIYAYGRAGQPEGARRMFERYYSRLDDDQLTPIEWMMAYLGVGDVERAYEWAVRAAALPPEIWPRPGSPLWLALNPMNDPVLERPEFLELRRQLGYRD